MYLIDRGKLLMQMMHKFHYELPDGCNNSLYGDVIKVIEDVPLIEAEPVRHGRWERTSDGAARCTACKRKMNPSQYGYAFCGLCGAKMDLEE